MYFVYQGKVIKENKLPCYGNYIILDYIIFKNLILNKSLNNTYNFNGFNILIRIYLFNPYIKFKLF